MKPLVLAQKMSIRLVGSNFYDVESAHVVKHVQGGLLLQSPMPWWLMMMPLVGR